MIADRASLSVGSEWAKKFPFAFWCQESIGILTWMMVQIWKRMK
jgi:hypothetical protein